MFGLFDVKVEDSTEVITLSDNTEVIVISDSVEPNQAVRRNAAAMSVDVDEVNSPPRGTPSRVRRKLFQVNEGNVDQISSTKSPSRMVPAKKVLGSSPRGSSCASWSPLPTSRKTAP